MHKLYDDLGMYNRSHSIFSGMKQYASMIFPSGNRFDMCSDTVSNTLLNVMLGLPFSNSAFHLRIFLKFVAADMLAKHLQGDKIDINTARKLYRDERNIHVAFIKALPPHI